MKLPEEMKDEKLGVAILYNYTKGYGKGVPMENYNVIIPLIFNDIFREEVLKHETLAEVMHECLKKDPEFGVNIKTAIVDNKEITTTSQGIAMIQGLLTYELVNGEMCGFIKDSDILDFNECKKLGEMMRDVSVDEMMKMLVTRDVKVVILQKETMGQDIDMGYFNSLGDVKFYEEVTDDMVVELCKDATVIATNKNKITAEIMDQLPNLKFIAEMATGYNNIDIVAAKERGIKVANVSGYSTDSVAQQTFASTLELINHTHSYDTYVKDKSYASSGAFSYFDNPIHEISKMTWGIVGLGAIGKKVASIASAFGANVIYYSPSGNKQDVDYEMVDFGKLLERSDVISIHAPLTAKTNHLFKGGVFKVMKKSAVLVNMGRGPIVEEASLVEALKNGDIAGAALDVYEEEPLSASSSLYEVADKLVLTPHNAFASVEARVKLVEEVYKNIEAFLNGKERNIVNG